jgi:hypothetical protein
MCAKILYGLWTKNKTRYGGSKLLGFDMYKIPEITNIWNYFYFHYITSIYLEVYYLPRYYNCGVLERLRCRCPAILSNKQSYVLADLVRKLWVWCRYCRRSCWRMWDPNGGGASLIRNGSKDGLAASVTFKSIGCPLLYTVKVRSFPAILCSAM